MGAPATNSETIHVVNKADNRQHAVVNLDSSLDEELPVSALRARPILLGLTSNNLSYARGGDLLHWYAGCSTEVGRTMSIWCARPRRARKIGETSFERS